MNIAPSIPNISYKHVSDLTSPPKQPVEALEKPSEAESRKGIIPGISGEFVPQTYPTPVNVTLGGLIDIRW